MNKRVYEKEFTKMVYDKLKEDGREATTRAVYWTVRYMLRVMADILKNGDKLILTGYFTLESKHYKERTLRSGITKQEHTIPERYYPYFKVGNYLERISKKYGEELEREKEEAEEDEADEM